jgi:hypothetical protein
MLSSMSVALDYATFTMRKKKFELSSDGGYSGSKKLKEVLVAEPAFVRSFESGVMQSVLC